MADSQAYQSPAPPVEWKRHDNALALIDGRWRRVTLITRVRRATFKKPAKWCIEEVWGRRLTKYEDELKTRG